MAKPERPSAQDRIARGGGNASFLARLRTTRGVHRLRAACHLSCRKTVSRRSCGRRPFPPPRTHASFTPMLKHLPNALTLARLILAPIIGFAVWQAYAMPQ